VSNKKGQTLREKTFLAEEMADTLYLHMERRNNNNNNNNNNKNSVTL